MTAYEMHMRGMAVPRIAHALGMEPDEVRAEIVGEWERQKAQHALGKLAEERRKEMKAGAWSARK